MKIEDYKSKIRQDHTYTAVRRWFGLYAYFWFHTEFWLKPLERRPYTFIFRDEIHNHPIRSWTIFVLVTGMLIYATIMISYLVLIDMLYGFLWGHLIWGSKYVPGEQESPQIEDC
jgi:hypothetical protein